MAAKEPKWQSDPPPRIPPESTEATPTTHESGARRIPDLPEPPKRRRALRTAGAVLGVGALFVMAAAAGAVVHVGLAPARRLVVAGVNQVLADTFHGKIELITIGHLGPRGVDGVSARLLAPDGERVALVQGLRGRVKLGELLWSALAGGDLRVVVTELEIDSLEARVDQEKDGSFTLAHTFEPAIEGPPTPTTTQGGTRVALRKVTLRHGWVHGSITAVPVIDGEIDGLAATFSMDPDGIKVDVSGAELKTRSMPRRADVAGHLTAHLALPQDERAETDLATTFAGTVGGVPATAGGGMHGKKVDAVVDVPHAEVAQLEAMLGKGVISAPASAHVEAHGTLPSIDPTAHVVVGKGTLDVRGHVTLPGETDPDLHARASITARDVDLRSFAKTAPASHLGLDASVDVRSGETMDGRYDVSVLAGSVAANATPPVHLAGTFTPGVVRGDVRVDEAGAPAQVTFALDVPGETVTFDARVKAADLARVKRLGTDASGRVNVHAAGTLAIATQQVKGRVEIAVDDLAKGNLGITHATVAGLISGSVGAPELDVTVAGNGAHVGSFVVPVFAASATGGPGDASARFEIEKGQDRIAVSAEHVRARGGVIDVEGFRVEGAGEPLVGEAHVSPGRIAVKVSAPRLDVPTLLRLSDRSSPREQGAERDAGHAAIDVDLVATRRDTKGHANVSLEDVSTGRVPRGTTVAVTAQFDGRDADVKVHGTSGDAGVIDLTTQHAKLAGGLLDPRAVTQASGAVHMDADVDLAKLQKAWVGVFPLRRMRGHATATADLARESPQKRPSLAFQIETNGLVLATKASTEVTADGTAVVVQPSVRTRGIDALVKGSVDAETGDARLDAGLHDAQGVLLSMNAAARLPVRALLAGQTLDALMDTRVTGHVETPLRALDKLPPSLGEIPVKGAASLSLDLDGSAREPRAVLVVRGRDIVDPGDSTPTPINLDAAVTYDGKEARAQVAAVRKEARVLDAQAAVKVRVGDIGGSEPLAWEASADAKFAKFPLGWATGFIGEEIDGNVNGTVAIHDVHRAGSLEAKLDLDKVRIEGSKLDTVHAAVSMKDGDLTASARMNQPAGFADVSAHAAVKWGAEIAPSFDEAQPLDVHLVAKDFRAAALEPFVRGTFSELDGRVNADTKIHVEPGMKDGRMDAAITIDEGIFEMPAIGEEFHGVKATIVMKPWGVWRLDGLEAHAVTGVMRASALANMHGLQLGSAEAHIRIAEKEKIPLTLQGVALGTAWGAVDATAKATPDGHGIDVDVNVPNLRVELPQSTTHGVQSTEREPTVQVGVHQDGRMVLLPLDAEEAKELRERRTPKPTAPAAPPTRLHVVTHLKNIEVKRDTTIKASITGGPIIDIAGGDTKMSGQISIPRGFLELQGKRFTIEQGTVSFTGQPPDNPVVVATASYDATDGTKIFADFRGPVKTGKVTLRSEPALSQNEILSALLFGSPDGTFGQASPNSGQENDSAKAAGLAGGVVTEGLNKAISGVSGVEVTTKVDTSESDNPRPEIEVALSRKVSATIIYNLGIPPPGQNPDTTLLTIDWRFYRQWSADTTVGDKGTSIVDLKWKHRY